MSKKDKEVQNIIERLEDLQVKQSGLLSRLERLSTSGDYARAQQPPTVATREFVMATESGSAIRDYYKQTEAASSRSAKTGSRYKLKTEQR
jgi:hypothetical protein